MKPMYLKSVEANPDPASPFTSQLLSLRAKGIETPQIVSIFAYKPEVARLLGEFTEVVMRGPSPLSAGMRELIAAFTSDRNHCVF